ncbi:MAG: hypothetical protein ACYDBH_07860 [Acidobacteriaceae bacterium]
MRENNIGESRACAERGERGIQFPRCHGLGATFTGFTFSHCPVLENRAHHAAACLLIFPWLCNFPLASASTTILNIHSLCRLEVVLATFLKDPYHPQLPPVFHSIDPCFPQRISIAPHKFVLYNEETVGVDFAAEHSCGI